MSAKSNACDLLKGFIVMVETHFQSIVQTVRSDNVTTRLVVLGINAPFSDLRFRVSS